MDENLRKKFDRRLEEVLDAADEAFNRVFDARMRKKNSEKWDKEIQYEKERRKYLWNPIVQIKPDINHFARGLLVIVEERHPWGIEGYIPSFSGPTRGIDVKLQNNQFVETGGDAPYITDKNKTEWGRHG